MLLCLVQLVSCMCVECLGYIAAPCAASWVTVTRVTSLLLTQRYYRFMYRVTWLLSMRLRYCFVLFAVVMCRGLSPGVLCRGPWTGWFVRFGLAVALHVYVLALHLHCVCICIALCLQVFCICMCIVLALPCIYVGWCAQCIVVGCALLG